MVVVMMKTPELEAGRARTPARTPANTGEALKEQLESQLASVEPVSTRSVAHPTSARPASPPDADASVRGESAGSSCRPRGRSCTRCSGRTAAEEAASRPCWPRR
jgi:hypothetical protein